MTSTEHPVKQEELMAYLDGELTAERAAELAAHVEQCVECRALVSDFGSVSEQLVEWQIERSSDQLANGIVKAAEKRFAKGSSTEGARQFDFNFSDLTSSRAFRWTLGLSAAGVAVLVLFAISMPNLLRSRQAAQNAIRASRERPRLSMAPSVPESRGAAVQIVNKGPMIARTASLSLVTKDFKAARAAIEHIATQHQGYIAKLDATGSQGAGQTLDAKLQIPASQLNAAIAELKQQGRVVQESLSGEEVTKQYTDLAARLANARVTEQRLNAILANRTGKVSDVLEVEQEVSRVRGEIERMDAERKSLETRVNFATIEVTLTEDYKAEMNVAPPSMGTELWNAGVEGYQSLVNSALGLAMAILQYGPAIFFWVALCFFPARKIWRRMRA
jgi:Domain of unknown function (DUF4349)/Putative zinc-finger